MDVETLNLNPNSSSDSNLNSNSKEAFKKSEKRGALERPLKPRDETKAKTSTRIFYEAQVEVIKKQLGSLEKIRHDLGLSQRKMGQLLLVDPSAWTRWNRKDEEAPPHIWRALQWYMAMNEKIPGLTPQYFIGKDPQILHQKTLDLLESEKRRRGELELDLQILKRSQIEIQEKLTRDLYFHRKLSYFFAALCIGLLIWGLWTYRAA
jgi:hypothetical protein